MKNYTEKERQEHVEKWKKGALPKTVYAKSAGIFPTTFYNWTKEKKVRKQRLVEISQNKLAVQSQSLVIEKGSMTVRLPLSVGIKDLQIVFAALGETK